MKQLFKKIICIIIVTSLCSPLIASAKDKNNLDNAEQFINEVETNLGIDMEIVNSVPNNVIPKEFDTWEEALTWIEQVHTEVENHNNSVRLYSNPSFINILNDGFEFVGDKGHVGYDKMPSAYSGTLRRSLSYNVPGASAQVVNASYYFEYNNKMITDSTGDAGISGIGLATFSITYNQLEQAGVFFEPNFYHVLRGNLGYFINVGGVNLGFYDLLELDYCIWNNSYIDL